MISVCYKRLLKGDGWRLDYLAKYVGGRWREVCQLPINIADCAKTVLLFRILSGDLLAGQCTVNNRHNAIKDVMFSRHMLLQIWRDNAFI